MDSFRAAHGNPHDVARAVELWLSTTFDYTLDLPATRREATLDQSAADESGLEIGDTLKVASVERVAAYRIVGLTKLGDASWGGASVAGLVLPEAQRVTDKRGEFDQILIAAEQGVSGAVGSQVDPGRGHAAAGRTSLAASKASSASITATRPPLRSMATHWPSAAGRPAPRSTAPPGGRPGST